MVVTIFAVTVIVAMEFKEVMSAVFSVFNGEDAKSRLNGGFAHLYWWRKEDSNLRPIDYRSIALATELFRETPD